MLSLCDVINLEMSIFPHEQKSKGKDLKEPLRWNKKYFPSFLKKIHLSIQNKLFWKVRVRSSCPEVFCKKGVLRNFAKFSEKHQYQSLKKEKHSRWLLLGITQEYYYSFDSANLLFLCSTEALLQVYHIKHYKHFVERFDRVYAVIDCSGVGIF